MVGPRRASRGVFFFRCGPDLPAAGRLSACAPPVSYGVRRLDAALPFVGAGLQTRPRDACVAISALASAGPDYVLPGAPSFALSPKGGIFAFVGPDYGRAAPGAARRSAPPGSWLFTLNELEGNHDINELDGTLPFARSIRLS